jgi:IclR family transcriptional regulator, acetate operon repressor
MQNQAAWTRSAVQSLDRAVAILNTFLGHDTQTLSQVADRTGLTRSTTHRLLASLQAHGLVEQHTTGASYSLGSHLFRLARAASRATSLIERAQPIMDRLRDETGETVGLHVRRGTTMRVPVLQAESRLQLRRTYTEIGEDIPIHLGAPGKLLLAYLPPQAQMSVLEGELVPATERTITDPEALRRELGRIANQGYALSLQERNPGVTTVAVPVWDAAGSVAAALSITGPAVRLPKKRLLELVPRMQAAARELTHIGDFDGER